MKKKTCFIAKSHTYPREKVLAGVKFFQNEAKAHTKHHRHQRRHNERVTLHGTQTRT